MTKGRTTRLRARLRIMGRRIGLNSIQGRLTAIAVISIFATTVVMGVVGFRFAANFERQRFGEHFQLLAANLAGNAELGLLLGSEEILRRLGDNMLAVRDVELVEIRDTEGRLMLQRGAADAAGTLGYAVARVISESLDTALSPLLGSELEARVLGEVRIGYSLTGIQQLKRQLGFGFLLLSLLLGLGTLFFYWRLSRAIRAPLNDVLAVAAQVAQGRMDVRADGGTLVETETLARAFNEMLQALKQQRLEIRKANELAAQQRVLAGVGKFSLTVAHEIKNPLAIINGSLEILRKDEPVDPRLKNRMLGFIDEEIDRINGLIEDFLLFARPQAPAIRLIEAGELSRQLSGRIALLDQRIDLWRDAVADDCWQRQLPCDLGQFERALFNVIRNALEVSSADKVRVRVVCRETHLDFEVFDRGPGIKKEQGRKMFEPFFTTKAKGTGLGLAIAAEVMKAHQGLIEVANNPDGGACFTLSLPLAQGDEPRRGGPPCVPPAAQGG